MRDLAPKIVRHGADEDKHGRIFNALLRKRGLPPVPVPPETDYTMLLERRGIGLAHEKLRRREPLSERDIVVYLAHSRVTEQRAADQMDMLVRYFGDHPEVGRAIHMISNDEDNHLAYCHEELLRLARAGHGRTIQQVLRESALAEISVYRDVSLAVMDTWDACCTGPRPRPPSSPRASAPCTPTSASAAGTGWWTCGCRSAATPSAAPPFPPPAWPSPVPRAGPAATASPAA